MEYQLNVDTNACVCHVGTPIDTDNSMNFTTPTDNVCSVPSAERAFRASSVSGDEVKHTMECQDVRCSRITQRTGPFCWQHTWQHLQLAVQPSRIPHVRYGLFAKKWPQNSSCDVVFSCGDVLCAYGGELYEEGHSLFHGSYAVEVRLPDGQRVSLNARKSTDGVARYANSIGYNVPLHMQNCELVTLSNEEPLSVALVATRDIEDGEELFCDYRELFSYAGPRIKLTL